MKYYLIYIYIFYSYTGYTQNYTHTYTEYTKQMYDFIEYTYKADTAERMRSRINFYKDNPQKIPLEVIFLDPLLIKIGKDEIINIVCKQQAYTNEEWYIKEAIKTIRSHFSCEDIQYMQMQMNLWNISYWDTTALKQRKIPFVQCFPEPKKNQDFGYFYFDIKNVSPLYYDSTDKPHSLIEGLDDYYQIMEKKKQERLDRYDSSMNSIQKKIIYIQHTYHILQKKYFQKYDSLYNHPIDYGIVDLNYPNRKVRYSIPLFNRDYTKVIISLQETYYGNTSIYIKKEDGTWEKIILLEVIQ